MKTRVYATVYEVDVGEAGGLALVKGAALSRGTAKQRARDVVARVLEETAAFDVVVSGSLVQFTLGGEPSNPAHAVQVAAVEREVRATLAEATAFLEEL
jgi:hypothetical protein